MARRQWRQEPFTSYVMVLIGRTGESREAWWMEWVDYSNPNEPVDGGCWEVGPFDDADEVLQQLLEQAAVPIRKAGLGQHLHPRLHLID